MPLKEVLLYIIGSLAGLGIVAGGLGFLIQSFSSGGRRNKEDVMDGAQKQVDFYKKQSDGFQEMMERKDAANADRINKLSSELGVLQGKYDERDKQYKEISLILKDRNPATEAFMKFMTTNAQEQLEYRKKTMEMFDEMIKVLGDIHSMSTSNHQMLQTEQDREIKVESTVTKQ